MCVCYVTTLYFSYNVRWREFLPRRWWLPKKEVPEIILSEALRSQRRLPIHVLESGRHVRTQNARNEQLECGAAAT